MTREKYAPGTSCTVNTSGDVFMDLQARGFFGVACVIVKRTKAGNILVARHGDVKHTYAFPARNIDVTGVTNSDDSEAHLSEFAPAHCAPDR